MTSYIQEPVLNQKKEDEKSVIEDVDEACVMMSEDEKFLNDDFIDEFVLDDLIDDDEDNKKDVESTSDEENSEKNSK